MEAAVLVERKKEKEKLRDRRNRDDEGERSKGRKREREGIVERRDEDLGKKGRERKRRRERERYSSNDNCEDEDDHMERTCVQSSKEKKSREEELEDKQKKLDEEMEKRRRRVQEWQELKRRKEEAKKEKYGEVLNNDEPQTGKTWTLEGESDDEEAGTSISPNDSIEDDDIIDSLDAYIKSILPEVEKLSNGMKLKKGSEKSLGRIIAGEDSDSDSESDNGNTENSESNLVEEDDDEAIKRVKKTKLEKLSVVDHSKIDYRPFRKNFYKEMKAISRMTSEEVATYRKELELKVHGKDVPNPVKTWNQLGLITKILKTIKKLNYEKPMAVQTQALPIIMSGRDCIGIAKTGSGKTLAFVIPMLRHIFNQPPVEDGDGPIGLIMAPTRELVQQIHSDIRKFAKALGIRCVPVYGGSGVAQQISDLKRGTEIVVCTPGRMIDILCTSGGKITNLRRVSYLVMDEADRMFDMGFEPQITRIVQNIRPDRQTVLFSATFPRQVEILARKVLNKPVEFQVGGRSVVNKDITQLVELRPETKRFSRLLELLKEWSVKGKILIFAQTQEKCNLLHRDLIKHGFKCLLFHGARDQMDRESAISDFKMNVCNVMTATSVAARGLDVKELELVINFDVPNHYEDYVHRVGRTGRAGRKGCAITFISEDDARYAPDLVKALQLSEQVIPQDLKALADGFMAKVNQGLEQAHGTGYGGSGFKFNEEEDDKIIAARRAQLKEYGYDEEKPDSEDEDDGVVRKTDGGDVSRHNNNALASSASIATPTTPNITPGAEAKALAASINLHHNIAKIFADAMPERYEAEVEINNFPQNARWKVTRKETLGPISEWTGASITTRGQFFPPGHIPASGDRKLYLFIEGPSETSVKRAKTELKCVLEDITNQALSIPGKYSL
ncbi:DEAD-box ATP-dependent RNA helicase 42-like [Mercurialis annua]|uniref:DEAD-box ATP-dependent RNA helicase 42-like n=1 Tax=Mercurialis annua TaxID=3986 RepID=UPI00216081E4|nr:DEAD-box ATP-dependent RNA helicase 42-like [Mercurialis annua]XP_050209904.1 DEAD-box ATP-dependent RNA helicase 42-like [Mercurialis annua]XP_050209905.1 DEAD-box ATP-dependent RNA helicase 42-like [Mercurialis annua]XP_055959961.1 DEAD-box ATP-dependent RNA helicase 42-like [Mercurialis annua]